MLLRDIAGNLSNVFCFGDIFQEISLKLMIIPFPGKNTIYMQRTTMCRFK